MQDSYREGGLAIGIGWCRRICWSIRIARRCHGGRGGCWRNIGAGTRPSLRGAFRQDALVPGAESELSLVESLSPVWQLIVVDTQLVHERRDGARQWNPLERLVLRPDAHRPSACGARERKGKRSQRGTRPPSWCQPHHCAARLTGTAITTRLR